MPLEFYATPVRIASGKIERLTYRLNEVANMLGISRRTLERERSAGRFPVPDLHMGKAPLWRPETLWAWLDSQSSMKTREG